MHWEVSERGNGMEFMRGENHLKMAVVPGVDCPGEGRYEPNRQECQVEIW